VAGAGGFSSEVPITLPPSLVVDKAHPLRVLAFGDSVMVFAQYGIKAALESTGEVTVVGGAKTGWGLTKPGAEALLRTDVRTFHPEIVVGTWSWDAAAAAADPTAYRQTLDTAIGQLLSPAEGVVGVILLQMPPFGPIPAFIAESSAGETWRLRAAGLPAWNEAIEQSSMTFPGKVMYLPVGSSLELDGKYTSSLPPTRKSSAPHNQWVRVRTSDGVHLCPPGITRYAAPVLADLTTLFHLSPPTSQWWNSYRITVRAFAHSTSSFGLTCPGNHPGASVAN
jgi:hypothetical protein